MNEANCALVHISSSFDEQIYLKQARLTIGYPALAGANQQVRKVVAQELQRTAFRALFCA